MGRQPCSTFSTLISQTTIVYGIEDPNTVGPLSGETDAQLLYLVVQPGLRLRAFPNKAAHPFLRVALESRMFQKSTLVTLTTINYPSISSGNLFGMNAAIGGELQLQSHVVIFGEVSTTQSFGLRSHPAQATIGTWNYPTPPPFDAPVWTRSFRLGLQFRM